ncbi:ABC-2 type transport system permease protein [Alteromonadaceae bacterium Bs31]|nr:ABC-2 type transport system permease protein [Alteromonadaceae bacterium Bs31]
MSRNAIINNKSAMHIAAKELKLFFASPIGYLFLGVFVAATLFIFFWWKSYFARNIADVRPMFEAMPVLLIFLSAALTMRMWSEERRSGTLEHVITLPVSTWQFVKGKFIACKVLLLIALLLTLPLPITISMIGNLDWGPVLSAYFATVLLGSAYLAIGLFISSRSDNQIVSLILTVLVCGLFYILGSNVFLDLVNTKTGELLRSLGSGSRFESITRGVLDIRDFYYYISIAVLFLVLNRYSLEKDRWADDGDKKYHLRWKLATGLILGNILALNFVLAPISALRIDTTEGKIYSISDATRGYLNQLQEPLLIRGYFSAKTHPLLAPLVPEIQDLLKEYAQQNRGQVLVEIIDPATNAEAEEEAGSKYGIRPDPIRVADRYQSSIVNSYFSILVQYGDEYKVLGFRDLIEVKTIDDTNIDVKLRNPEYDITNAVKQVLYAYQSGGNLFDSIKGELTLNAYVSSEQQLPESLLELNGLFKSVFDKAVIDSEGKFKYQFLDPNANGGALAQELAEVYGFQPMASSLFDVNTFYYYLVLQNGEIAVQVSLPEEFTEDSVKRVFDSALKRFASGFTKTVGFVAPKGNDNPYAAQMGQPMPASFNSLQAAINESMTAVPSDLSAGKVNDDVDLLMVLAPENLDDKAVFAIDQFLMQGGTVVMATSPYKAQFQQQSMAAAEVDSKLESWLSHHGLSIDKSMVMDMQNSQFPVPVTRQVGMFSVREYTEVDYPFFMELREKELNQDHPVSAGLMQLSVPWASPIMLDAEKNTGRSVTELAKSSANSWLHSGLDISPSARADGSRGFEAGTIVGPQVVAVAVSGRFDSFFKGKESPLLNTDSQDASTATSEDTESTTEQNEVITTVLEHSPESARLIVVSSNAFAEDTILNLQSSTAGNNTTNPLQFMLNAVEWSLEDEGLLSIRSRSHFNRTLPPLSDDQRQFWEVLNYGLAIAALFGVYLFVFWRKSQNRAHHQRLLSKLAKSASGASNNATKNEGVAA